MVGDGNSLPTDFDALDTLSEVSCLWRRGDKPRCRKVSRDAYWALLVSLTVATLEMRERSARRRRIVNQTSVVYWSRESKRVQGVIG